jgi:hypothetical protein
MESQPRASISLKGAFLPPQKRCTRLTLSEKQMLWVLQSGTMSHLHVPQIWQQGRLPGKLSWSAVLTLPILPLQDLQGIQHLASAANCLPFISCNLRQRFQSATKLKAMFAGVVHSQCVQRPSSLLSIAGCGTSKL